MRSESDTRSRGELLDRLVWLSRELGRPERDLAVLGEGNTSALVGEKRFLVKASGTSLGAAAKESFVMLDLEPTLALLDLDSPGDEELGEALMSVRSDGGPRPSIEAAVHAICLSEGGALFVGHTHPTAINAILCSDRAGALVAGALFPDQIVVCGRDALLVPYTDPGLPLARAVRDGFREHTARTGQPPKTIYLQNHGLIALGQSAAEVDRISTMATKAARILLGALSAGEPTYLSEREADRIERRPDEHHRRRMLQESPWESP